MNARDDKLRQFAYRAAVADNISRIGPAFGKTVGKYWYRDLIVQSWYDISSVKMLMTIAHAFHDFSFYTTVQ